MNAEFNRMRTDLANNFASAGAALLDYMTIDGTKTAALAAIPETDPQQYAIAGTLAGIAQMLPKAGAGVEATSAVTDGDSARAFVDAWHREHFPTDRTFSRYIMGRDRHCALAGDFAWQLAKALESLGARLAATTQASTAQAEPVALQQVKECLIDVVTHHADFRQACDNERESLKDDGDREAASYWAHQIAVLDRMKGQAEAALAALNTPVATSSTDAQAAAEVRDAARYRWWRKFFDGECELPDDMKEARTSDELDAAIDRALRAGDTGGAQ